MHHVPADEIEATLVEVEQDRVADDEALVVHGDELLGMTRGKAREVVDPDVGEQSQRIRTGNEQVGHVVRLVEQCHRRPPGALF